MEKKKIRLNLENFTLPKEIHVEADNVVELRQKVVKECLRVIEEQIRTITFDIEDKQIFGKKLSEAMYLEVTDKAYGGFGQFFNPTVQRIPLPIPTQYVLTDNKCIDEINKVVTDGIPYERLNLLTVLGLPDTYYTDALSAFNQIQTTNQWTLRRTIRREFRINFPIKDIHLSKLSPAGKFRVLEFLEGLIGYSKRDKGSSYYSINGHKKEIFGITEDEFGRIIFNLQFDSKYANAVANIKLWYKEEIK